MDLHRAQALADWANIAPAQRSRWQRWAVASNGIVTPGNIITLLGLAIVLGGLIATVQHHDWLGLILILLGRLCDLLDGWVAQRTRTKSQLGARWDALADKFGVAAIIIVFAATRIVPLGFIVVMLLPQAIIAGGGLVGMAKGWNLQPSLIGKISMAEIWLAVCGYLLAVATHNKLLTGLLNWVAVIIAAQGVYAAVQYWQQRHKTPF